MRKYSDISKSIKYQVIDENNTNNGLSLAIIGSRTFKNYWYAKKRILEILDSENIEPSRIISGGADGSDKIAEMFADEYGFGIDVIVPDWSIGKYAGLKRNTEIVEKSDCVIAFWDFKSRGTLDSINKAKKLNKPLYIVDITENKINEEEGISLIG